MIESILEGNNQIGDIQKIQEELMASIDYCNVQSIHDLEDTIKAIFYILNSENSEFEVTF